MKLAHTSVIVLAGSLGIWAAAAMQPATTAPTPTTSPTPPTPPAATAGEAAPGTTEQPGNLRRVVDMFRSDLNASKIRTLNEVMKLTAAEAEKFWPIYRRYEIELGAVDDRRIALIKEFIIANSAGKLSEQTASEIATKWLAVVQDRLDLWKKYHKEIGAAVSSVRAAQFLQIEHQISLLVDINIASEMPLVDQQK